MRRARIRLEGTATYHCLSRVIQRQMLLGDTEKERFRALMRQTEDFCGVRILTYAILTNHFHIVVQVPFRQDVSDHDLVWRIRRLYGPTYAENVESHLLGLRRAGEHREAERLKGSFTHRMYDLSEFMKTLKQRYTQWYNRRKGRKGTLWEQRFTSVLVEGKTNALRMVAGYVDLNPVRAGLVEDPKDYRFCGYAEAVVGDQGARTGLAVVMKDVVPDGDWRRVARAYRQTVFERGGSGNAHTRIDPARVRAVLAGRGELSRTDVLRCRVRYFSDGLVLGGKEFVESVFRQNCGDSRPGSPTGACAMRFAAWDGLCIMRNLRQAVLDGPD